MLLREPQTHLEYMFLLYDDGGLIKLHCLSYRRVVGVSLIQQVFSTILP